MNHLWKKLCLVSVAARVLQPYGAHAEDTDSRYWSFNEIYIEFLN